jgi:hypothetical protein
MRIHTWTTILATAGLAPLSLAQETHAFDARGIFYHTFEGSFDGSEWFQSIHLDATDAVHMGDINAGGAWAGTVDGDGNILLGGGSVATGMFSDADHFDLHITVSGFEFDSLMNRVPGTTPDFPVQLDRVIPTNWKLAGLWDGTRSRLDPRTGEVLETHDAFVIISTGLIDLYLDVEGFGIFSGVFNTHEQAGFRVVLPRPNDVRYRSFPGSTISINRNMLGELFVEDINRLSWTLMLQTRQSVGNQSQELWVLDLERVDPLLAGDMDTNGRLEAIDRGILDSMVGTHLTSGGFDIAGDLIRDGVIDAADLAAWDRLSIGCPRLSPDVDADGVLSFYDVSRFLASYFDGELAADFSDDGVIDFADVSAFLDGFNAGCR